MWLSHREQALLPHWIFSGAQSCAQPGLFLGGGILCSARLLLGGNPVFSRVSSGGNPMLSQASSVGAKLARDSGGSACIHVGCASVIASKLCSQRFGSHR